MSYRKCKVGFPCGKSCISRTKECRSNIGQDGKTVTETFAQFCNRIVGIGGATESAGIQPQPVKAGENVTEVLGGLKSKPQSVQTGRKFNELTDSEKKAISSETDVVKLLNIVSPGVGDEFKKVRDKQSAIEKEINDLVTTPIISQSGEKILPEWYATAILNNGSQSLDEYEKTRGKYLSELYQSGDKAAWKAEKVKDNELELLTRLGYDVGYYAEVEPFTDKDKSQFTNWVKKYQSVSNDLSAAKENKRKLMEEIDNNYLDTSVIKTPRREINEAIKERDLPMGSANDPDEAKMQAMIDDRTPMLVFGSDNLGKLFDNGIFKNIFDIGAENPDNKGLESSLEERRDVENQVLNVPLDEPNENRPIYGFMGNNADLHKSLPLDCDAELPQYGNMVIKFKPEVKDDITVTMEDSLIYADEDMVGSPANAVSKKSIPSNRKVNQDAKYPDDVIEDGIMYMEWQSGRRLSLDDVDSFVFPINIWAAIPQNIKDMIISKGIKVELMAPREVL
jgi:hypothetical protein